LPIWWFLNSLALYVGQFVMLVDGDGEINNQHSMLDELNDNGGLNRGVWVEILTNLGYIGLSQEWELDMLGTSRVGNSSPNEGRTRSISPGSLLCKNDLAKILKPKGLKKWGYLDVVINLWLSVWFQFGACHVANQVR